MEGLWKGIRRCCRGLICFSLTDGNSQRKLITLPSHISMCVCDVTRGCEQVSGFLRPSVFLPARVVKRLSALACDCFLSFTRSLLVSLFYPPHVCLLLSSHLFYVLDLFVWSKANSYSCLCVAWTHHQHVPHTGGVPVHMSQYQTEHEYCITWRHVKKPLQEVTQEVKLQTLKEQSQSRSDIC